MSRIEGPREEFSWRAHPARERLGYALAAGFLVVLLGFLSAALMRSSLWGILAVALMCLALNRFFFPSRFSLDVEGITARYPLRRQRLRWTDLRRFAHDDSGGYLSTRAVASRLDAFRGMHLLFGGERDAVISRIRDHMAGGAGS